MSEIFVPFDEANTVTRKALIQLGHSEDDAQCLTDLLLWAQTRGNNQSLVKIPSGGMNPTPNSGDMIVEFESKLGIRINGHNRPGIVGLTFTCDHAIRKVKEHGMAIAALNHTCTGTGPIGYYARRIAEQGFIGLVLCQSFELMAPHGGYKALYGTNPIAYGIPRKHGNIPIVFDAAMSGMAYFALHELKSAGKEVPPGLAYDVDGNETLDPAKALAGALRTFDNGPKGSHLAMMVELLGGALAGGDVLSKRANQNWGTTIIAIDPNILGDGEAFLEKVESFVQRYKEQPVLESMNGKSLILPGERSEDIAKKNTEAGGVMVITNVWNQLKEISEKNNTN